MDAKRTTDRDGGQKVLKSLVFQAQEGLFAAFCLSQAEIILEAEADCLVERELESLIVGRMGGDAAEEGVDGGGRIGGLGKCSWSGCRQRENQRQRGKKNRRARRSEDKMLRSFH